MHYNAALLVATLTLSAICTAQDVNPFVASGLVPEIVPDVPATLLQVDYGNGVTVQPGIRLEPLTLLTAPKYAWQYEADALYTVIMIDPDFPLADTPIFRSFLHFLAMNVKGNDVYNGHVLVKYLPTSVFPKSGKHRYVFLVYKQYQDTSPVNDLEKVLLETRLKFSLKDFVKKHYLGALVAGNFFTVEK